ncbi:twin-arginine translocation signal domain-containing protein, partial [Senegalimassilia anaerobia]
MSKEMSRRDLLKMSGLAAAGVAGASLLGGCAPKAASS